MSLGWEISSIIKKVFQALKSKPQVFCDQKVYCEIVLLCCFSFMLSTEVGGCFTCFKVLWLHSVSNANEGYYTNVFCPVFFLVT